MNNAIIKYSLAKIIRQPITSLVFIVELIITLLIVFVYASIDGGRVMEINFFGFVFDEPYIIKQMAGNLFSILFLIIFFLLIIIANRFFHEFKNDPLLEIILPKLKIIKFVPALSTAGFVLIFMASFSAVIAIALLNFQFKFGLSILLLAVKAWFVVGTAVIYISAASLILNQFLDGFTSSIILAIPLFFGNVVYAWVDDNVFLSSFNYLFPLSKLSDDLIKILIGEKTYFSAQFIILAESFVFLFIGNKLFLNKWK